MNSDRRLHYILQVTFRQKNRLHRFKSRPMVKSGFLKLNQGAKKFFIAKSKNFYLKGNIYKPVLKDLILRWSPLSLIKWSQQLSIVLNRVPYCGKSHNLKPYCQTRSRSTLCIQSYKANLSQQYQPHLSPMSIRLAYLMAKITTTL